MSLTEDFQLKTGPHILDPKSFVQLPRPGEGRANDAGDLVFVIVSKFSISEKKNHRSLWIAALESKIEPYQVALPDTGDAFWLDDRTIGLVISKGEEKAQELYAIDVTFEPQPPSLSADSNRILIGTFPEGVPTSNFKYTSKGGILVFSAFVWPDRELKTVKEQDEKWNKRDDSALIYEEMYVRHWDAWRGTKVSSLFSVRLTKIDGKWKMGDEFVSILKGFKHDVPVEPFGGTDNFDISDESVVYTTKDPEISPATHTRQNIYIINLEGKKSVKHLTLGTQGATNFPVFNKTGDKVAWTEMDKDVYEADRAKIVIYDLAKDVRYTLTQSFDRSAIELCFSIDGKYIYFTAKDIGRTKIYRLPVPPTPSESTAYPNFSSEYQLPSVLTETSASSAIQILPNERLLCTQSSSVSPNDVYILRGLDAKPELEKITHFSEADLAGKDMKMPEEVWFKGAEDKMVHSWVHLPPGFEKGDEKKWPAIAVIHGGPQLCFEDIWSTRWNGLVWAHQGYVVFQPNITGSTSYGQDFVDAINKDWGGKPFIDLQKGWRHLLKEYPQIDPERCAAAGGSYGGYAINWIQGHPEWDMNFKAVFCHNGVFDIHYSAFSTDELFFKMYEFGGEAWLPDVVECIKRNNPSELVAKWSIPQLIVHNCKDYRVPETEGVGAFQALQRRGVPSRLVVFPDENHFVLKHLNSVKWHYEIFRWFSKYLDGYKKN